MTVRIEQLPADVQALVRSGWHAVVYKGTQVWAVFSQLAFAQSYVGDLTGAEGVYEKGEFQIVGL